ncbi:MAG: DUF697 domain-containing protein [Anaerolineales bacterium]|nr:DUF697 domain-containing protein [Anaerolineales bacterium]
MTITRTRKTPTATPRSKKIEMTPEQFIAGAETPAPALLAPPPLVPVTSREALALKLVGSFLPWSAGAGILPLPGIDMVLIIGVQLRMLAKLAELYGVPFKEQAAKSLVATLMANLVQNSLLGSLAYAFKFTPVLGPLLGIAGLPAVATAGTFALGKVFITHLEAGGSFDELDPKKMQEPFHAELEKSRPVA